MSENSRAVLWCVNIQGPDDLVAAPTYLAAARIANAFNAWWVRYRKIKPLHEQFDARMWALPIEWPGGDAESHAKAIASPSTEYQWLIEQAEATQTETEHLGSVAL